MKEIVFVAIIIGKITTTAYQSLVSQTDNSPYYTSTGEHVRPGGVAVSRDLLCPACKRMHKRCLCPVDKRVLHYGDYVFARDLGFLQVNDVMGDREHYAVYSKGKRRVLFTPIRRHIDVWVGSRAEEHAFYKKWKGKAVELYKVEER